MLYCMTRRRTHGAALRESEKINHRAHSSCGRATLETREDVAEGGFEEIGHRADVDW